MDTAGGQRCCHLQDRASQTLTDDHHPEGRQALALSEMPEIRIPYMRLRNLLFLTGVPRDLDSGGVQGPFLDKS